VLGRYRYEHPVFDAAAAAAQGRHAELDGARRTFFCGAYWRNGFHEDGVASALAAVEHFNAWERHAQLHLRRAG
jgi:predicted NAD/FAD-binding protein